MNPVLLEILVYVGFVYHGLFYYLPIRLKNIKNKMRNQTREFFKELSLWCFS